MSVDSQGNKCLRLGLPVTEAETNDWYIAAIAAAIPSTNGRQACVTIWRRGNRA